jgi:hypothetical protein
MLLPGAVLEKNALPVRIQDIGMMWVLSSGGNRVVPKQRYRVPTIQCVPKSWSQLLGCSWYEASNFADLHVLASCRDMG